MATVIRSPVLIAAVLAGCGELAGFAGDVPPLATVRIEVTGDLASLRPPGSEAETPRLTVALAWGAQWLPEPLCILPPESEAAAAVLAQGCRDPFGFVPDRIAANLPIEPNLPTELRLFSVPAADVMVGDVTARVAYASLVVYDDRNGNGTLDLRRSRRLPGGGGHDDGPDSVTPADIVYGASFVSMTAPDVRLAFREGGFDASAAFYPRVDCGAPLPGFSVVAAGGFSAAEAIAAALRGELPAQDPATCWERAPESVTIPIPLRAPDSVTAIGCTERRADGSARYREPPMVAPDLTGRLSACAALPDFGMGSGTDVIQLIVSGGSDDPCPSLTRFVLRGCEQDPLCDLPDWDFTATPPAWWPCPLTGP